MLEILRLVADWLGREDLERENGVNDLLADLALDDNDPAPELLAGVYDETRDDEVAARQDPPEWPALYVTEDLAPEAEGEVSTQHRDFEATVAIRYLTRAYDRAKGVADTKYTLRAIQRSLRQLTEGTSAERTRNQVCLLRLVSLNEVPVAESVGEYMVTGALLVRLEARDADP